MSNLKSPFLRVVAPFVDSVETVMKMLGVYEFLPSNDMMIDGGKLVCKDESPVQELCANVLFLMSGYNSQQLNRTIIPAILENTPAGDETIPAHELNQNNFFTRRLLGGSACALRTRNELGKVPNVRFRPHKKSVEIRIAFASQL